MSRATTPPETRFWRMVDKSGECWEWVGGVSKAGYGLFKESRQVPTSSAHRYALKLAGVAIPSGMEVDHLCRNKRCVNPAHLEAVTHSENNRRAHAARPPRSSCAHGHLLTPDNLKPRSDRGYRCVECQRKAGREYAQRKRQQTTK